jgi:hypothetical protein
MRPSAVFRGVQQEFLGVGEAGNPAHLVLVRNSRTVRIIPVGNTRTVRNNSGRKYLLAFCEEHEGLVRGTQLHGKDMAQDVVVGDVGQRDLVHL